MNKFFKNYREGFNPYKLNPSAAYEFATMWVAIRDGEILEEKDAVIVNLASTSKPFTMDLLSKVLKEDKFIATKALIKELIFRKQNRHLEENPAYSSVLTWLLENKVNNPKSKLRAILSGTDVGLYNWKAENFPEVIINFEELCFNALTLSSNSAIEIARNKLEEILGSNIQSKFDDLKIAPTLQLHAGGFKLLEQSRANSGDLIEIVKAFNRLTLNSDPRILKAMNNNPVFFDVGATSFVKDNIWEKTGVAWPINYGLGLAQLGYPPHMVMGTLFSIKEGEHLTSFGIFKVIAIAVPKSEDSNGFSDIYEKNYTNYVNLVKYKFLNKYRKELFSLIRRHTTANIKERFYLRELFKKVAIKLRMLF